MPTLHIMDRMHGDKRLQWDVENKKDLKKIEDAFNEKKKEGFLAIAYEAGSKVGKLIHKFDETFDRIVMIPPMTGG